MGENLNEAELPIATNPFERFVIFMLQKLDSRTITIERNVSDIIETQVFLVNQMVTHDELETKLEEKLEKKLEEKLEKKLNAKLSKFGATLKEEITTDLKTYFTFVFEKDREEIRALIKKCDGRTDDITVTLERKKVISVHESQNLLRTSPFLS